MPIARSTGWLMDVAGYMGGWADPADKGYRDLKAHMRGKFIFLDQTEPNQQSNKQERRKWRLATKSQRMQFAYLSATLDRIFSKIVFNL
jgi:hypothetical protein